MVKDAEAHADEDRKFHELVTARNQADAMLHATEKSLKEMGDKVDAEERSKIEAAITALREVLTSDDKEEIEAKTNALTEASGKLAEQMYANADAADGDQANAEQSKDNGDDVVDAEFEEVKENKS
jgi:molecular chaperone DnaK